MRVLAIATLFFASTGFALSQTTIRQVDFKNFTYPRSGPLLAHNRLMWLDSSAKSHINLRHGEDDGFTLSSVKFAKVTGEGNEDAIVVLHYDTGGTQQTDYIYVYTLDSGHPKLLAYCYTGDRGSSGLQKVYGQSGKLIVELYDPAKASGDCCSSGFIRTAYVWRNGQFLAIGPRRFGKSEPQNYSVFGQRVTGTEPHP